MISLISTLIIVGLCAILLLYILKVTEKPHAWKHFTQTQLRSITKSTDMKDVGSLKAGIIELDSLLDYAFKGQYLTGNTMGERLKSAKMKFDYPTYNNIWKAHKMRNTLVHEAHYKPTVSELKTHFHSLTSAISAILAQ